MQYYILYSIYNNPCYFISIYMFNTQTVHILYVCVCV